MEGLLIAQALKSLAMPARNMGWAFPDETTAALLMLCANGKRQNLVLGYRPPEPKLWLSDEDFVGDAKNPFQRSLATKLKGDLVAASQPKLDRVIRFSFAASTGFVGTEALDLLFELTGRNCNLMLLEPSTQKIVSVAREVTASQNRFRQVRQNGLYFPPPPYEKIDPRFASPEELQQKLSGKFLANIGGTIDGIGPMLTQELAARAKKLDANLDVNAALDSAALVAVVAALKDLAANPNPVHSNTPNLEPLAPKLQSLRGNLTEVLKKKLKLLNNQIADVARAHKDAALATQERNHADTLMAFGHMVERGASKARLPTLDGLSEIEIALDATLNAAQNAGRLYERAKRRQAVLARLIIREPDLLRDRKELQELFDSVPAMTSQELQTFLGETNKNPKQEIGMRFLTRHGYEVVVGRNNKENELVTHKLARSEDLWFHVQGYPGSHTLLRAKNKTEVPYEDILEAAAIAAKNSKARNDKKVAVDYTFAKHVWRPKGAAKGLVHYAHQKTVFVDPGLPVQQNKD